MLDRVRERALAGEPLGYGERSRSGRRVLGFAALLTALVVGVVPTIAVLADVSPLPVLVVALGIYALAAVATGDGVPAVVAAIPVLVTVNADVPLWTGPNDTVELAVVLGDVGIVAGVGLLVLRATAGTRDRSLPSAAASDGGVLRTAGARAGDRLGSGRWRGWLGVGRRHVAVLGLPAAFLAAFAVWALIGAAFAAHDARTAAVFAISQLRYVVYFAVVAGLVAVGYAGLRSLALAYVTGVLGHAGFALAQFWNGDAFGLSVLGEPGRVGMYTVDILGTEQPAGRFLGGLTGNNAAFASLAIPAAAVLVWIALGSPGVDRSGWGRSGTEQSGGNPPPIERRRPIRAVAALGVAAIGALCVPLSQYDSATFGFLGTVAGSVVLASVPVWPAPVRDRLGAHRGAVLAGTLVGTVAVVVVVLAVGAATVLEALPLVSSKNFETRIADYRRALDLAVEHPFFGYGGGNVETVATEIGFSADIAIHSILFSYLAETGFVGAGLWVAAVATIGVRAAALARSSDESAVLAGVLCVGALGFLAVAMIDQIWDNHTSLGAFWLFAGAIAATAAGLDATGRSEDRR